RNTPPCLWPARSAKPFDQKRKHPPRHQRENQLKKKKKPALPLARAERKPFDRKRKLPRATSAQRTSSSIHKKTFKFS
ncbi:hypothetical protein, partial [Faecalibacterium prausnitzii]|uniref:hypothetical protein n=1 Tax=Faecalibacterium prausnitzii TaxID=853 RepID=UPI0022E3AC9F